MKEIKKKNEKPSFLDLDLKTDNGATGAPRAKNVLPLDLRAVSLWRPQETAAANRDGARQILGIRARQRSILRAPFKGDCERERGRENGILLLDLFIFWGEGGRMIGVWGRWEILVEEVGESR